MAILKILTYPDPTLEKKSIRIDNPTDPEIRELVLDMLETMETNNGLGLAAPQIGKSLRLCIVKLDGNTYILINPKIQYKSFGKDVCEEGCLSFPGKFIPVKRAKKIRVTAQDRDGKKITIKADGLLARALQHEIDHLDGILFVKKIAKIKRS